VDDQIAPLFSVQTSNCTPATGSWISGVPSERQNQREFNPILDYVLRGDIIGAEDSGKTETTDRNNPRALTIFANLLE
jgi:hypothetical protein